jgi:hypothetical protein
VSGRVAAVFRAVGNPPGRSGARILKHGPLFDNFEKPTRRKCCLRIFGNLFLSADIIRTTFSVKFSQYFSVEHIGKPKRFLIL